MAGDGNQERSSVEEAAAKALRRGDRRETLALLMEAYGAAIYRYCLRQLGHPQAAEDALQTTFLQAYQSLTDFSGRSSLRAWLYGIARNRCLDAAKAEARRRRRFEAANEEVEAVQSDSDAEKRAMSSSLARLLAKCLEKLSGEVREAVRLRFQDELTYPEMAGILGLQPAALQARVARALPTLRACLEQLGVRL